MHQDSQKCVEILGKLPYEVQEYNAGTLPELIEIAENIQAGFPYIGIWRSTLPTISNLDLIENAVKDGTRSFDRSIVGGVIYV